MSDEEKKPQEEAAAEAEASVEVTPEATPEAETPVAEEATEEVVADEVVEEAVEEDAEVLPLEVADVRVGQTVKLHLRINDGKKERIQIYQGIVIATSGSTPETKTITVRKAAKGYGVEKIIPLAMPSLEKIEVTKVAKVGRSKLYYLRNYKKRLKERTVVNN